MLNSMKKPSKHNIHLEFCKTDLIIKKYDNRVILTLNDVDIVLRSDKDLADFTSELYNDSYYHSEWGEISMTKSEISEIRETLAHINFEPYTMRVGKPIDV